MEKNYSWQHHSFKKGFNLFLRDKYNDLLIADTLRTLALSMVAIFIPIFLLQNGFSLLQVVILELISCFIIIWAHYLILKKIGQWGVKRTLVYSYCINIIYLLIMIFSPDLVSDLGKILFLSVLAIFNISSTAAYWTAHHLYFIKTTDSVNEGEKAALLTSIPTIIAIASPFLGGVLISGLGFYGVFICSVILLFFASVSLFMTREIKSEINFSLKKTLDFKNKKKNLIFFIQGIVFIATSFIWPVYMFLASIKIISMGLFYLFSNILYSITCYWAGKTSDHKEKGRQVAIGGSLGHGLSLILRALAKTPAGMAAFLMMGGFFGGLLTISLEAHFYKHSHENPAVCIMNRELYMHLGRVFLLTLLTIGLIYLPAKDAFVISLLASGSAGLLISLIVRRKK